MSPEPQSPELEQFMTEAFRIVGQTASRGLGIGALVGVLLGLVAFFGLSYLGAWRGGHKLAGLGRGLVGLWFAAVTAVLVGVAGAALGAWQGTAPALLSSELDAEFFVPMGKLAADAGARVVALAPELVGVPAPAGAPTEIDALAAARAGAWSVPVDHVRKVADGYGAALRGPDGVELERRLLERTGEPFPPQARALVQDVVRRLTTQVRAGKTAAQIDPALAEAWAGLEAAAAADGEPELSHAEAARVAVDGIILPVGLRQVVGPAQFFLVGAIGLLLPAWALPASLAWLLRRRSPAA